MKEQREKYSGPLLDTLNQLFTQGHTGYWETKVDCARVCQIDYNLFKRACNGWTKNEESIQQLIDALTAVDLRLSIKGQMVCIF